METDPFLWRDIQSDLRGQSDGQAQAAPQEEGWPARRSAPQGRFKLLLFDGTV